MIKVIVFDVDGTLTDSNRIKRDAYFQQFDSENYPIIQNVIEEFEPATRYTMISEIVSRLMRLGKISPSNKEQILQHAVQGYGEYCEEQASTCPEIPGAIHSIQKLSKQYALYVNSHTPIQSLTTVLRNRGLIPYFQDIFGSEKSKTEQLQSIIETEQVEPFQVVMVGDGILDIQCARECGTHFIGINNGDGVLEREGAEFLLPNCMHLCKSIEQIEKLNFIENKGC